MQIKDKNILFSPSDLITFLNSNFASHMERSFLEDQSCFDLMDPKDPMLQNLQNKGYQHENDFLTSLIEEGKNLLEIKNTKYELMVSQTKAAMSSGVDVIAQACLQLENFIGIADFLVKVPRKSNLGEYQYEVWDTKLSKKMKPYFAIQLCCYAEMLEKYQGLKPQKLAIVLGN